MLTIIVPGNPVGKGRPRFTRSGHAYTPEKTVNAEAFIKAMAIQCVGTPMLLNPLAVTIEAVFCIPVSWSQKKRETAASGVSRPTGRPDIDNIGKAVGDALNGIVWRDDSQIVDMRLSKRYGLEPMIRIMVEELDG